MWVIDHFNEDVNTRLISWSVLGELILMSNSIANVKQSMVVTKSIIKLLILSVFEATILTRKEKSFLDLLFTILKELK